MVSITLHRAAFQFGIKMSDGRKTRRIGGEKNEKAELDREWQQISQVGGVYIILLSYCFFLVRGPV